MLARHAENMFWVGRHVERAEDTARLLDVTYHGLLQAGRAEAREAWGDVLEVLHLERPFKEQHGDPTDANVSEFLVVDGTNPGSIVSSVGRARENVRAVRELISSELWEAINTFYLELGSRDLRAELDSHPYQIYALVKRRCQTIAGVAGETMLRDDGWRFLILGWMLERAEMTCRLLRVRYSELATRAPSALQHWMELLQSASALEAYRRHARGALGAVAVLEFLLMSPLFPRSVLYCVRTAEEELVGLGPHGQASAPLRRLGRLRADLEYEQAQDLLSGDLQAFLDRVQEEVWVVADGIAGHFFRPDTEHELCSFEMN